MMPAYHYATHSPRWGMPTIRTALPAIVAHPRFGDGVLRGVDNMGNFHIQFRGGDLWLALPIAEVFFGVTEAPTIQ